MKKSFLLHIDSLCILEELDDEQKGQLFNAIYKYQLGEQIELSPIIKIAFSQFKNQFIRDEEKYKSTCEKRKLAGSKGGKQRVANQANATKPKQTQANQADNKNKNKNKSDNDNVKDSDNKNNFPTVINDDATRIADYLHKKILSNKPNFKQPNLTIWAKDIDLAMRIDKRSVQELKGCIDWIYTEQGSFWIPNIMSCKKLREKFDTMESQMMKKKSVVDDIYSTGLSANDIINEAIKRQG